MLIAMRVYFHRKKKKISSLSIRLIGVECSRERISKKLISPHYLSLTFTSTLLFTGTFFCFTCAIEMNLNLALF